jgi:hypothetical protein
MLSAARNGQAGDERIMSSKHNWKYILIYPAWNLVTFGAEEISFVEETLCFCLLPFSKY